MSVPRHFPPVKPGFQKKSSGSDRLRNSMMLYFGDTLVDWAHTAFHGVLQNTGLLR